MQNFRRGDRIPAGPGYSTVLPDWDFETYSAAGFVWDEPAQKYRAPLAALRKGLPAVGSAVYTQHPSIEVLSLQYDLKDGAGARWWRPGMPRPADLIDYLGTFDPDEPASYTQAGLIEAHNSMFELRVATEGLHKRYGWPAIHLRQLRCSAAKCRAHAIPGALADAGKVLDIRHQKDPRGMALIKRFTHPRDPTPADPRHRIDPTTDAQGPDLYAYNLRDIEAEGEVSSRVPDLNPAALDYWLADQAINYRGVGVDSASVAACVQVLRQALEKYDAELYQLTGGQVAGASKVQQLREWLDAQGVYLGTLDSDAVDGALLGADLPADARRALEIRRLVGSASVKKIYSMARMATAEDRLCDLFIFHGSRTGRDAHADVQPGNLPKAGPAVRWCESEGCNRPYAGNPSCCPWCGASSAFSRDRHDPKSDAGWTWHAVPHALEVLAHGSVDLAEWFFGDALLAISGCVRGMFVAGPRKDLICSDYSSIEAVVTAALSGEQWRLDAFARRDDIYLTSAAKITGRSLEWYMENGGKKHPDRQYIGKPAELGLGFGGWIGAWRQFDSSERFSDDAVKENIVAWREASPSIVEFWGGQTRGRPWAPERLELFGLEGCAIAAIQSPGQAYAYRGVTYMMQGDALYCRLLSGRLLTYHRPRLGPGRWDATLGITFEGWNTNPKKGGRGWIRMPTYGGSLAENVIQGTAFDVMAHAVPRLEAAGYPIVLRVHDELAAEVPEGAGSIEEFEKIMADLPDWCAGWPIRAAGGWRGKRYRKD